MRARNLELNIEAMDPDGILRSAKEESNSSAQGPIHGDNEICFVFVHRQAGNGLEHWPEKRIIA